MGPYFQYYVCFFRDGSVLSGAMIETVHDMDTIEGLFFARKEIQEQVGQEVVLINWKNLRHANNVHFAQG